MLFLVVVGFLITNGNTYSIITWGKEGSKYSLLLETASSYGVAHLGSDVKSILKDTTSGHSDDDVVVLHGTKLTLLNSFQPTVERGKVLTAGSRSCTTACDLYNRQHLQGDYPYLDSSIVVGYRSDVIQLLPDDMSSLQDVLTEKYLGGSEAVVVDVVGGKIASIDKRNFKKVEFEFTDTNNTLLVHGNRPDIVLLSDNAPLPAARLFSEIGRYVGNGITRSSCNFCSINEQLSPTLFIAVYITERYPFLSNLLASLQEIEYDKSKIELVVLSLVGGGEVDSWTPHGFQTFTLLLEEFDSEDQDSRQYLLEMYSRSSADYFVYIDSSVYITPGTIPQLVAYQKPVISPMLVQRDGTAWSNFWGTFTDTWGYKRSSDYDNILTRTVQGVMPVACVRNMYIVQRAVALDMLEWNVYDNHLEPDLSFCKTLFENQIPVFVSNVQNYGWLKSLENATDLQLSGQYMEDWKIKYVTHEVLKAEVFSNPCKNIFLHTSAFTDEFAKDLVAALDTIGQVYQQKPKHFDWPGHELAASAYNETLTSVVLELTRHIIPGLYPGYKIKEQLYDSWIIEVEGKYVQKRHVKRDNPAAYHVLIPLNHFPGDSKVGYQFRRQDCKITDLKAGDMLIFPGFITHQKIDIAPQEGMHLYLEMSFDLPH